MPGLVRSASIESKCWLAGRIPAEKFKAEARLRDLRLAELASYKFEDHRGQRMQAALPVCWGRAAPCAWLLEAQLLDAEIAE